jgi:hypothetical protein
VPPEQFRERGFVVLGKERREERTVRSAVGSQFGGNSGERSHTNTMSQPRPARAARRDFLLPSPLAGEGAGASLAGEG